MQLIKRIDRAYYASMMTLVVPLILQNLINASVTLVDNLMVGTLGDVALGAVNITSQFYLKLFNIIIFGIVSGAHSKSPILGCQRHKEFSPRYGNRTDRRRRIGAHFHSIDHLCPGSNPFPLLQ
jgi:Na+-driven multidrug efflux pump